MKRKLVMPMLAVVVFSVYLILNYFFWMDYRFEINFKFNYNDLMSTTLVVFFVLCYAWQDQNLQKINKIYAFYDILIKVFIVLFLSQFVSSIALTFFSVLLIIITLNTYLNSKPKKEKQ